MRVDLARRGVLGEVSARTHVIDLEFFDHGSTVDADPAVAFEHTPREGDGKTRFARRWDREVACLGGLLHGASARDHAAEAEGGLIARGSSVEGKRENSGEFARSPVTATVRRRRKSGDNAA